MKIDLGLQVAASAFVDALAPAVAVLTEQAGRDPGTARGDVAAEAYELARAFIDADRRATDEELWAFIVAFAPLVGGDLLARTPDELRAERFTDGAAAYLTRPSPLFLLLVDADRRDSTQLSTDYYEHAVALGFMTAALDGYTGRDELLAIERFRAMLLAHIRSDEPLADGDDGAGPPDGGGRGERPVLAGNDTSAAPTGSDAGTEPGGAVDDRPPPRPLDDLLAELDALIGMDEVKAEIKLVTNLTRVQQLRRQRGLKTVESSRHLIFTGNPGTGKTTVARLLAEIYRTLGVVERGHLVETDRSGLVAGFVGQTATKVVEVFDRADGGVLLIDEAYALARGGENDFGKEAVDTIVKLVEDRRDRVVVIAAGYPDEMADFVGANPGLPSRFPKSVHFPDYRTDELVAIFGRLCEKAGYLLDADAERRVAAWIDALPRDKGFGNGRLARNLFEAVVARQAGRVVEREDPTDIDLVLILPADVPEPGERVTGHG